MIEGVRGSLVTNNWSVEYDGRSITDLLGDKPNATYGHAKMVIVNEGGFIDGKGIIHKGSATNKIAVIA